MIASRHAALGQRIVIIWDVTCCVQQQLRKPLGLHLAPPLDRPGVEFIQEWCVVDALCLMRLS